MSSSVELYVAKDDFPLPTVMTARPRPSAAWRAGFLLNSGWPPESRASCSARDLLAPGVTIAEAPMIAQQSPRHLSATSSWSARYPAWWTASDNQMSAAPPSTPPEPVDLPPQAQCALPTSPSHAMTTPYPQPVVPVTAEQQTQTTPTAVKEADAKKPRDQQCATPRTSVMPCMRRPRSNSAATAAASKVRATLRRHADLNKALAEARRRRLEAIVSGVSSEDVPISMGEYAEPTATACLQALPALAIAQRFLSSNNEVGPAAPLAAMYGSAAPLADQVAVPNLSASDIAIARYGLNDTVDAVDVNRISIPGVCGDSPLHQPQGWYLLDERGECAAAADGAEAGPIQDGTPRALEWGQGNAAAHAAQVKLSPRTMPHSVPLPSGPHAGRLPPPPAVPPPPPRPPQASEQPSAQAWEVDIAELRGPAPPAVDDERPRQKPPALGFGLTRTRTRPTTRREEPVALRPTPSDRGRRSHAGWVKEVPKDKRGNTLARAPRWAGDGASSTAQATPTASRGTGAGVAGASRVGRAPTGRSPQRATGRKGRGETASGAAGTSGSSSSDRRSPAILTFDAAEFSKRDVDRDRQRDYEKDERAVAALLANADAADASLSAVRSLHRSRPATDSDTTWWDTTIDSHGTPPRRRSLYD